MIFPESEFRELVNTRFSASAQEVMTRTYEMSRKVTGGVVSAGELLYVLADEPTTAILLNGNVIETGKLKQVLEYLYGYSRGSDTQGVQPEPRGMFRFFRRKKPVESLPEGEELLATKPIQITIALRDIIVMSSNRLQSPYLIEPADLLQAIARHEVGTLLAQKPFEADLNKLIADIDQARQMRPIFGEIDRILGNQ